MAISCLFKSGNGHFQAFTELEMAHFSLIEYWYPMPGEKYAPPLYLVFSELLKLAFSPLDLPIAISKK